MENNKATYTARGINLLVSSLCDAEFSSIADALAAGKRTGFEIAVDEVGGNCVASWSPLYGTRYVSQAARLMFGQLTPSAGQAAEIRANS